MSETITLDPSEFIENRAELSLDDLGLAVRETGADWGESQVELELVRQALGEEPSNRHLPNVEMTIPLRVREEGELSLAEVAYKLQQKIGLLQQEEGWIRRDFDTEGGFAGSVGYQVVSASISGLQGWLMAHHRVAPDVTLKIVRKPFCYATEEIESEAFSTTTERQLVFELAEVLGTAPGLIRLKVTNGNTEGDWSALIVALESRDYPDPEAKDTTAALTYAATDHTLKGGSTEAEREGTKVVRNTSLSAGWLTILDSKTASGHLTHRGVRRMLMRIYDPGEEAGNVQLRLRWRALGALSWSENDIVPTPLVDGWQLVDLGECRPESPALGEERWEWQLQARAPTGAGQIDIARTYPLPAEQMAKLVVPAKAQGADTQSTKSPTAVTNVLWSPQTAGNAWTEPTNAKTADGLYASVELEAADISKRLTVTDFGFGLPEDATPVEALVTVKGFATHSAAVSDASIRLTGPGGLEEIANYSGAEWPTTNTERTYRFDVSSLTAAQVNNSEFGAQVAARTSKKEQIAKIDHISITVYYTEAADENRVCFATRSLELRSDGCYRQHPEDDVWGPIVPEGSTAIPYAPASGMEQRPLRGIVIPSQGDLGEAADAGTNKIDEAKLFYRPAYHFAREAA